MTDLDKMARELLADSVRRGSETGATLVEAGQYAVVETCDAEHAIRIALLTVPPGYKLVPVEPTPEMVDAYHSVEAVSASSDEDADDQWAIESYRAMLAAAPEPKP